MRRMMRAPRKHANGEGQLGQEFEDGRETTTLRLLQLEEGGRGQTPLIYLQGAREGGRERVSIREGMGGRLLGVGGIL